MNFQLLPERVVGRLFGALLKLPPVVCDVAVDTSVVLVAGDGIKLATTVYSPVPFGTTLKAKGESQSTAGSEANDVNIKGMSFVGKEDSTAEIEESSKLEDDIFQGDSESQIDDVNSLILGEVEGDDEAAHDETEAAPPSSSASSHPTVLIRTPYNRQGIDFIAQRFAERGYYVVTQDVRGTFESEGQLDPFLHEASDGKDTLKWIRSQQWHRQCPFIITWGISYLGLVQYAMAQPDDDPLKAPPDVLIPILCCTRVRNVMLPFGGFNLTLFTRWLYLRHKQEEHCKVTTKPSIMNTIRIFGSMDERVNPALTKPLQDMDTAITGKSTHLGTTLLKQLFQPPTSDFWQRRRLDGCRRKPFPPTLMIAGWHDIFFKEQMQDWAVLSELSDNIYLTIGNWAHFDIGCVMTGFSEGVWFMHTFAKAAMAAPTPPTPPTPPRKSEKNNPFPHRQRVRAFLPVAERWCTMPAFPPPCTYTALYLHNNLQLSFAPDIEGTHEEGFDSYVYDPADPTPTVAGADFHPFLAGSVSNNDTEKRKDILVYTSNPLPQDMEIMGSVVFTLFFKSSLQHVDFFVRLCCVSGMLGTSLNVCDGYIRITPGLTSPDADGVHRIQIDLGPSAYVFRKGECIRLHVASGAHPRYLRNNGTGDVFCTDLLPSSQTIFRSFKHASALVLPVTSYGKGQETIVAPEEYWPK